MFKIEETQHHGKAVVATKRIEPGPFGHLVFTEEALLTIPTRDSGLDRSGKVPKILEQGAQMWTDWCSYLEQPREIQRRILDMYADMECPHAAALRNYLLEKQDQAPRHCPHEEDVPDNGGSHGAPVSSFDGSILDRIDEFVKFSMVVRFNSVELCPPRADGSGPGTDYGHGLFENACTMNHSCKPNCVWLTTQDGKAKDIRAISTIEKGEELTVDYMGSALEPIPQRRQELLTSKGFVCDCHRCSAVDGDDTRRFRCIRYETSSCPGVHFLDQPLLSSEPELRHCNHCGAQATQSYTLQAVQQESELLNEIRELDRVANEYRIVDVSDRIVKLEPPHQLHCLADRCYELQGELYSVMGEYKASAEAYAKQLKCRTGILGRDHKNCPTAFCCERMGDALRHVDLDEAEKAYQRALCSLQLLRGGRDDPYSECVLKKLLDVQHDRQAHEEPKYRDSDQLVMAG